MNPAQLKWVSDLLGSGLIFGLGGVWVCSRKVYRVGLKLWQVCPPWTARARRISAPTAWALWARWVRDLLFCIVMCGILGVATAWVLGLEEVSLTPQGIVALIPVAISFALLAWAIVYEKRDVSEKAKLVRKAKLTRLPVRTERRLGTP